MSTVDRARLAELHARERASFTAARPRSRALAEQAAAHMPGGVPMSWMVKWPGDSPAATVEAVTRQLSRGITTMLPTQDAIAVSTGLAERFGLPYWQFTLTATDANRHAIRYARHLTRRSKVVVHNWCYHGSVDEAFATVGPDGSTVDRRSNIGAPVDTSETTRVVEFNDLEALERALAQGDVAAILVEPALTNIGIVLPDPGYNEGVRELATRYGALRVNDETNTICTGPGGYTGAHGL